MALQICVEYAYTANLEVPDVLVQDVYLAAWQLRIDNVVRECARHLVEELCADSCIETRSLPGINKNKTFVQKVDAFIAKEVSVAESNLNHVSVCHQYYTRHPSYIEKLKFYLIFVFKW